MKITTALESIVELVESTEAVATALEALRKGTTDEEWDAICDNPLVDALISACMDVESHVA